ESTINGRLNDQERATPQQSISQRKGDTTLTGEAAMWDWMTDAAGMRRKLTPADIPAPYSTKSVRNHPRLVPQAQGATPQVPQGFRVEKFAEGLSNPRMIRTAPNGDLFIAESEANRIRVLRDANSDGKPDI